MAILGILAPRQVSHVDVWMLIRPIHPIMLLHMREHHLLTLDGYHNVGHKIPTDQLIRMYLYLYKFS